MPCSSLPAPVIRAAVVAATAAAALVTAGPPPTSSTANPTPTALAAVRPPAASGPAPAGPEIPAGNPLFPPPIPDPNPTAVAAPAAAPAATPVAVAGQPVVQAAPAATPAAATPAATPAIATPAVASSSAMTRALGKVGAPYRWGAAGPNAFDCSGLVNWAYRSSGVALPRTSQAMSRVGTPVSRADLRPGDLIFFYRPVSHVGIYLGDGKIVHASSRKSPVKISDMGRMKFNSARRV